MLIVCEICGAEIEEDCNICPVCGHGNNLKEGKLGTASIVLTSAIAIIIMCLLLKTIISS